jgi:hypothetical protein
LDRLPEFARRLADYHQDGNNDLLAALDQVLEQAAGDGAGPERFGD